MSDTSTEESSQALHMRVAAMDYLARREHSRRELRDKLLRRFDAPDGVEEVIETLARENLQSDTRFAESYLRQRAARGYGPLRIRQELRQRGVDEVDVEHAFRSERLDWEELAGIALRRKFGSGPAADLHEKSRRSRFLQYRGFAYEHFSNQLD